MAKNRVTEQLKTGSVVLGEIHTRADARVLIKQLLAEKRVGRLLLEAQPVHNANKYNDLQSLMAYVAKNNYASIDDFFLKEPDEYESLTRGALQWYEHVRPLHEKLLTKGYSSLDDYLLNFPDSEINSDLHLAAKTAFKDGYPDEIEAGLVFSAVDAGVRVGLIDGGRPPQEYRNGAWGVRVDGDSLEQRNRYMAGIINGNSANSGPGTLALFGYEHLRSTLANDGTINQAIQEMIGVDQNRAYQVAPIFEDKHYKLQKDYYPSLDVEARNVLGISMFFPYKFVEQRHNTETGKNTRDFYQLRKNKSHVVINAAGDSAQSKIAKIKEEHPSTHLVFSASDKGELNYVSGAAIHFGPDYPTKVYVLRDGKLPNIPTNQLLIDAGAHLGRDSDEFRVRESYLSRHGDFTPGQKNKFDQRVIVNTDSEQAAVNQAVQHLVDKHPENSIVVDPAGNVLQGVLAGGSTKVEVVGHAASGKDGTSLGGLNGKQITDLLGKLAADSSSQIDRLNLVGCGTACAQEGPSLAGDVYALLLRQGLATSVKGYQTPVLVDEQGYKRPASADETNALGKDDPAPRPKPKTAWLQRAEAEAAAKLAAASLATSGAPAAEPQPGTSAQPPEVASQPVASSSTDSHQVLKRSALEAGLGADQQPAKKPSGDEQQAGPRRPQSLALEPPLQRAGGSRQDEEQSVTPELSSPEESLATQVERVRQAKAPTQEITHARRLIAHLQSDIHQLEAGIWAWVDRKMTKPLSASKAFNYQKLNAHVDAMRLRRQTVTEVRRPAVTVPQTRVADDPEQRFDIMRVPDAQQPSTSSQGAPQSGVARPKRGFERYVIVNTEPGDSAVNLAVHNLANKHPENSVVVDLTGTRLHGSATGGRTKVEVVGHGVTGDNVTRLGGLDGTQITDLVKNLASESDTRIDKVNLVGCGTACAQDGPSLVTDVHGLLQQQGVTAEVKGYRTPLVVNEQGRKQPVVARTENALGKGDPEPAQKPQNAGVTPPADSTHFKRRWLEQAEAEAKAKAQQKLITEPSEAHVPATAHKPPESGTETVDQASAPSLPTVVDTYLTEASIDALVQPPPRASKNPEKMSGESLKHHDVLQRTALEYEKFPTSERTVENFKKLAKSKGKTAFSLNQYVSIDGVIHTVPGAATGLGELPAASVLTPKRNGGAGRTLKLLEQWVLTGANIYDKSAAMSYLKARGVTNFSAFPAAYSRYANLAKGTDSYAVALRYAAMPNEETDPIGLANFATAHGLHRTALYDWLDGDKTWRKGNPAVHNKVTAFLPPQTMPQTIVHKTKAVKDVLNSWIIGGGDVNDATAAWNHMKSLGFTNHRNFMNVYRPIQGVAKGTGPYAAALARLKLTDAEHASLSVAQFVKKYDTNSTSLSYWISSERKWKHGNPDVHAIMATHLPGHSTVSADGAATDKPAPIDADAFMDTGAPAFIKQEPLEDSHDSVVDVDSYTARPLTYEHDAKLQGELANTWPQIKTEPPVTAELVAETSVEPLEIDAPVKEEVPITLHTINNLAPVLQGDNGEDVLFATLQPPNSIKETRTSDLNELIDRQVIKVIYPIKLGMAEQLKGLTREQQRAAIEQAKQTVTDQARHLLKMSGEERAAYMEPRMTVVDVPDKGRGVQAARDLPALDVLGPYAGKLITDDKALQAEYEKHGQMRVDSYTFGTRYDHALVSAFGEGVGNITSLINEDEKHLDTNVSVVMLGNYVQFYLTTKPVKAGTDLLIDYGARYVRKGWPSEPINVEDPENQYASGTESDQDSSRVSRPVKSVAEMAVQTDDEPPPKRPRIASVDTPIAAPISVDVPLVAQPVHAVPESPEPSRPAQVIEQQAAHEPVVPIETPATEPSDLPLHVPTTVADLSAAQAPAASASPDPAQQSSIRSAESSPEFIPAPARQSVTALRQRTDALLDEWHKQAGDREGKLSAKAFLRSKGHSSLVGFAKAYERLRPRAEGLPTIREVVEKYDNLTAHQRAGTTVREFASMHSVAPSLLAHRPVKRIAQLSAETDAAAAAAAPGIGVLPNTDPVGARPTFSAKNELYRWMLDAEDPLDRAAARRALHAKFSLDASMIGAIERAFTPLLEAREGWGPYAAAEKYASYPAQDRSKGLMAKTATDFRAKENAMRRWITSHGKWLRGPNAFFNQHALATGQASAKVLYFIPNDVEVPMPGLVGEGPAAATIPHVVFNSAPESAPKSAAPLETTAEITDAAPRRNTAQGSMVRLSELPVTAVPAARWASRREVTAKFADEYQLAWGREQLNMTMGQFLKKHGIAYSSFYRHKGKNKQKSADDAEGQKPLGQQVSERMAVVEQHLYPWLRNAPTPFDMEKAQAHVATKMTFDWVTARAFNQVFRPFDKPAFAAALAYSNMPFILRSSRSFAVNAEKHGTKYRTVRQWMTLRGMWKKGPYSELNLQRSARDLTVRPSPLQPSTPPFPMRPATDGHTSPPYADGFIDVAHPPLISLDTGDDVSAEQSPPPLRIDLSGDESDYSSMRF